MVRRLFHKRHICELFDKAFERVKSLDTRITDVLVEAHMKETGCSREEAERAIQCAVDSAKCELPHLRLATR